MSEGELIGQPDGSGEPESVDADDSLELEGPVHPDKMLSESERERYSHQLALPGWDRSVQADLRRASAFVVGIGSLGSAAAAYLVGAGVGHVAVIDGDDLKLSDLPRQFLNYTPELGSGKAEAAAAKLSLLNPAVHVDPFPAYLNSDNASAILGAAGVVIDCSADLATTYAINDACLDRGIPLITARPDGFGGKLLVAEPGKSACFRCAFPAPPLAPADEAAAELASYGGGRASKSPPTLGPVAGVLGSLQALEALKLLTGVGDLRSGELVSFDGLALALERTPVARRADCSCMRGSDAGTV